MVDDLTVRFTDAVYALHKNPSRETAAEADTISSYYLAAMYGASPDMTETQRLLLFGTNFINDARTCIDSYRKVEGNQEYIDSLVAEMERRMKLARNIALYGPESDIVMKELDSRIESGLARYNPEGR